MSPGFTRGPWRVPSHAWFQVVEESALPGDACVAMVYEDVRRGRLVAEAKANAHLIAAAPDLLEVCKAIIYTYENADAAPETLDKAYAAVAKAEGKHE